MIEFEPKGCIDELNFGYKTKAEGYVNVSSDITELSEIMGEIDKRALSILIN